MGGFAQVKSTYVASRIETVQFIDASKTANRYQHINEKRLALVVGVSNYRHWDTLENDDRDVDSMVNALTMLNFDIVVVKDADTKSFRQGIESFKHRLSTGDYSTALFYFSGHGKEWESLNYLLAKDFPRPPISSSKPQIHQFFLENSVKLDDVLAIMKNPSGKNVPVKIAFIDACRDSKGVKNADPDELLRDHHLITSANAQAMKEESGVGLFFSTTSGVGSGPGQKDGNSTFTKHLLLHIRTPGMPYAEFTETVTRSCFGTDKQLPYPMGPNFSTERFFFNPATNKVAETKPVATDLPLDGTFSKLDLKRIDERDKSYLYGELNKCWSFIDKYLLEYMSQPISGEYASSFKFLQHSFIDYHKRPLTRWGRLKYRPWQGYYYNNSSSHDCKFEIEFRISNSQDVNGPIVDSYSASVEDLYCVRELSSENIYCVNLYKKVNKSAPTLLVSWPDVKNQVSESDVANANERFSRMSSLVKVLKAL